MVKVSRLLAASMLILASLTSLTGNSADVQSSITLQSEQESIYLGDSVIIDVEAIGLIEDLDVSPLFRDADLLRETRGTRIAVINERVVEVKLRRMEFLPRKLGTAFFGPLTGEHLDGTTTSNALRVTVSPAADTDWSPTLKDHSLAINLSSTEAHVGQRLTLDIILKHRYPITDESISLPDFSGFDVLPVFESRRTIEDELQHNADEKPLSWRVIAWRYLLFPQRSGALKIGDIIWTGEMIRSRTQRGKFQLAETFPEIAIKPAATNDSWWLPATNVKLNDSWSIDVRELSAGDEVIRRITLIATDVLANHLPVIEPLPSRAITSTLIRQTRQHDLIGDVVTATANFEFRMTAQSPIPVFLDTVRVPWWNTVDQIDEEAIIPARRINVGLPDRQDLLSDVALAEEPVSRILLALQSSGRRWSIWYWALAALSVFAIWVLVREIRWQFTHHRARLAARARGQQFSVFDEL